MLAALFTPNTQQEPDFCAHNRVSSVLAAINSCSSYSKDLNSSKAGERRPVVNGKANKSRPKFRASGPSQRSLAVQNTDRTNGGALLSTGGKERGIKCEKSPAIVRAEDIRIEPMDPSDPRYNLPVPARNLHQTRRNPTRNPISWRRYYDDSWDEPATIIRAEDIRIEPMDPSDPRNNLPVPSRSLRTRPRRGSDHDSLNWTFCYDDSCLVHMSEKEGKGYYPSAPY